MAERRGREDVEIFNVETAYDGFFNLGGSRLHPDLRAHAAQRQPRTEYGLHPEHRTAGRAAPRCG